MQLHREYIEMVADSFLTQAAENKWEKPNYTNRDFMNALIIFQTVLMDKVYDNQDFDKMPFEDRITMTESCGKDLRKLIHTYTGLDTYNIENFI